MDFIPDAKDRLFESFFEKFDDLWSRPNQSRGFRGYVLGLIGPLGRKNVEAISQHVVGGPNKP